MHFIHQDGPAVYKFAVRKMAEATIKVLERNGVTGAELGCFIPHQANKRIITATADRLGMDRGAGDYQYRQVWQHFVGDHSAGHGDGYRRGQAEEGRPGAAGRGGRGVYVGSGAAAVGDLRGSGVEQVSELAS